MGFAWSANALIVARIITGVGMGGEYPLASSHSAESAASTDDGARNVALLYLFGSGFGPVLCDLVTFLLDCSGMQPQYIWRSIFAVGSLLALAGLILRFITTENAGKFTRAAQQVKGTRRNFIRHYWQPLLGTALIWLLFDIVEYGLKQNDAAIFSADSDAPYRTSILTVFVTRVLVIPSLAFAPWLLKRLPSKRVQLIGFLGCMVMNLVLACGYDKLKNMDILFDALYIFQLSFQSLPGVTTMAIPAEIYPSALRGTGAAISAASGKVGATLGSYFFTMLQDKGFINEIFWTVTVTATLACILTMVLTPLHNGATLDKAEDLADQGKLAEAKKVLFSGPLEERTDFADLENEVKVEA